MKELFLSACEANDLQRVQLIFSLGGDVNRRREEGFDGTGLHIAARGDSKDFLSACEANDLQRSSVTSTPPPSRKLFWFPGMSSSIEMCFIEFILNKQFDKHNFLQALGKHDFLQLREVLEVGRAPC